MVLSAILLAFVSRGRQAATTIACTSNLRQIYAAFVQYSLDHERQLPDPYAAGMSWEQMLRPYLDQPAAFRCGDDDELFPSIGSSYDWRDTGNPRTTLAGKSMTDCDRPAAVLVFDALPGWHGTGTMNAAMMDGSARLMKEEQCLTDLQAPLRGLVDDLTGTIDRTLP